MIAPARALVAQALAAGDFAADVCRYATAAETRMWMQRNAEAAVENACDALGVPYTSPAVAEAVRLLVIEGFALLDAQEAADEAARDEETDAGIRAGDLDWCGLPTYRHLLGAR